MSGPPGITTGHSVDETQASWDAVRALAKSRTVGAESPAHSAASGSPGRRVPVRELRRTMDRVDSMYQVKSPVKMKKRAEYDTSSDEEERKSSKPPARSRRSGNNARHSPSPRTGSPSPSHGVLSPGKVTIERKKNTRRHRVPPDRLLTAPVVPDAAPMLDEGTVYERSLKMVAHQTVVDGKLNLADLEGALEATGATTKLRAMTNEEVKRDRIERSMYELAEIPPAVMGHLKRTIWSLPDYDAAKAHFKSKCLVKENQQPYNIWRTFTGRFCFTSGICRMAALCDPIGEGTRSEIDRLGLPFSRYFKFVKFMGWLMVIAMLLSLPNMLLFSEGGQYRNSDATELNPFFEFEGGRFHDSANLSLRPIQAATYIDVKRASAAVTPGNILPLPDNVTAYAVWTSVGLGFKMSEGQLALAITIVVCIVAAALAGAALWFWVVNDALNSRETWNPYGTVTIEEYSVSVTNLPKFTTRDELRNHLELVTKEKVREIVLAEDFRDLCDMLKQRNTLMQQLDLLDGRIQYIKHEDRAKAVNWNVKDLDDEDADEKKLREEYEEAQGKQIEEPRWVQRSRKLDNERRVLLQELNLLLHRMEGRHFAAKQVEKASNEPSSPMAGAFVLKPPIVAYVTFYTVAGRHACLAAYPKGLLHRLFMSPGKRLRDHRIDVRQAPAPASLAWEHIGTPPYVVRLRELLYTAITALLLVIPFLTVHVGRKVSLSGYSPGENDGLVDDRTVKPCDVDPNPMLALYMALNDTSLMPSTHCVCSWRDAAASSTGLCQGWHASSTLVALGPFFVVVTNLLMGAALRLFSKLEGHYSSTS